MKKILLFGTALFVAASSFSQNARLSKPSGALNAPIKNIDPPEPTGQNSSVFVGPVKKARPTIKLGANKTMAVTATNFTGSMNVLGYLLSTQKPLHYTRGIDAISFVARKSTTYTASSNSNSGTIVGLWSTNGGATWDETCIWSNANNLARYPQGIIYNPLGNTNINNAHIVGIGPFTSGAGGWGGTTNGHWYASKQITTPGNTTSSGGLYEQSSYYQGGPLKAHYMNRNSISAIDGGLIRSLANIVNDPAGTTNVAFGLRGILMTKGTFNAGTFVWSVDSFKPPVGQRTDGSLLMGSSTPIQAWRDDGVVGYVITIGSRASETISPNYVSPKGGHQPIVYITTNGGASWSLLPAVDFADPINFKGVNDRMYPVNNNTTMIVPNFQGTEGIDAVVDFNGQLHLVTMNYGHYYNHVDSLGYRYVFGTEQYSYGEVGPFEYPIIYDFYTKVSGGWDYHMVDSMGTEGPGSASGDPGYASNQWTSATAKYTSDARIQASRSADGTKIFYSWTESDSSVTGVKWNMFPDLYMKGYDLNTNKVSGRVSVTNGVLNATQNAYWHFMSSKAAQNGVCYDMPLTISHNPTYNGDIQVDTYYLSGVQFCNSSYMFNPLSPKGLGVGVANTNTEAYEVMNFPNPADHATTIAVNLKDASNFDVTIHNSIGQLIDTYKMNGHVGVNEINIDLSNFKSGIYFYNVNVNGSVVTKKLIVQ